VSWTHFTVAIPCDPHSFSTVFKWAYLTIARRNMIIWASFTYTRTGYHLSLRTKRSGTLLSREASSASELWASSTCSIILSFLGQWAFSLLAFSSVFWNKELGAVHTLALSTDDLFWMAFVVRWTDWIDAHHLVFWSNFIIWALLTSTIACNEFSRFALRFTTSELFESCFVRRALFASTISGYSEVRLTSRINA